MVQNVGLFIKLKKIKIKAAEMRFLSSVVGHTFRQKQKWQQKKITGYFINELRRYINTELTGMNMLKEWKMTSLQNCY